jgi:tetratricopeptide (TPR) repeat protein
MDCQTVEQRGLAEAYVAGRLEATERDALEEHYFECDECMARIEACGLLRRGLREQPLRRGRSARRLPAFWWPLATAAVALLTVVVWWARQTSSSAPGPQVAGGVSPTQGTAVRLAELGRFEPPPYRSVAWRGGSTEAQRRLESGMQRYVAHDYSGAIPHLRNAAALAPAATEAHFFLGVSLLLVHDVDGGIASLERASSLGDTPYLESVLLYLAKGYLLKGDRLRAEQSLQRAIALRGDLESACRDLLRQLNKTAESRP